MPELKIISYTVPENLSGERVDKALSGHPEISSRSRAAKLIAMNLVTIQGKPVKPSHKVTFGETFEVSIPVVESGIREKKMPLDILFEDSEVIVLNKPAGLVVHPGDGHHDDTLVNGLVAHTDNLSMGFGERRPGIVHRLDKGTSGILVVAKNDFSHEVLAKQFKNRTVHRLYWAIIYGAPRFSEGSIRSSLGRHPTDRKRFAAVTTGGKESTTHYVLRATRQSELSLLHLKLETGRTHQIRVHLSEQGHPIVGDKLYGSERRTRSLKSNSIRETVDALSRFALHAAELGFEHPKTKKFLFFKTTWPEDLLSLVKECGFEGI